MWPERDIEFLYHDVDLTSALDFIAQENDAVLEPLVHFFFIMTFKCVNLLFYSNLLICLQTDKDEHTTLYSYPQSSKLSEMQCFLDYDFMEQYL